MFYAIALFSFILSCNSFLNSAQQQLSSGTKPEQKRVHAHQRTAYAHQRSDSKDDFCIKPKSQPTDINNDESKKRRALSTSYNVSPVSENPLQSKQSRSAPIHSSPIVTENFPTKSLSDSSVNPSNKKKHGYSPLNIRSKKKTSPTTLAPIAEKLEHGLLTATRNLNIDLIKFYLSGSSFNPNKPKDRLGNTAFHIIAAQKNQLDSSTEENVEEKFKTANAIIDLFLKDFRTDFSIKNNAGSTPRELLSSKQDTILRMICFSRCSLNTFVNKYAKKLKNAYSCGSISPEVIEGAIQQIIGELKGIEASQQEDRALPSESRFPAYATIYFIEQMLLAQLNYITNDN